MDPQRFDEMTRVLAAGTSRRTLLHRLGTALGGALAFGVTGGMAAPKAGNGGPQGRCAPGFTNCRGTCVDLLGDRDNCGACATACPDATICLDGTCACPNSGETYVGGACVDLATDPQNCGGIGELCPGTAQYCVESTCVECAEAIPCPGGGRCESGACVCGLGSSCTGTFDCCRIDASNWVYCHEGVCGGPGARCNSLANGYEQCASGVCITSSNGEEYCQ